jgi:hypothetical protein
VIPDTSAGNQLYATVEIRLPESVHLSGKSNLRSLHLILLPTIIFTLPVGDTFDDR